MYCSRPFSSDSRGSLSMTHLDWCCRLSVDASIAFPFRESRGDFPFRRPSSFLLPNGLLDDQLRLARFEFGDQLGAIEMLDRLPGVVAMGEAHPFQQILQLKESIGTVRSLINSLLSNSPKQLLPLLTSPLPTPCHFSNNSHFVVLRR